MRASGMQATGTISLRPFGFLAAERIKMLESKAGMSGRLGEIGMRWMIPGSKTMPGGRAMMGRVPEYDGAMIVVNLTQVDVCHGGGVEGNSYSCC